MCHCDSKMAASHHQLEQVPKFWCVYLKIQEGSVGSRAKAPQQGIDSLDPCLWGDNFWLGFISGDCSHQAHALVRLVPGALQPGSAPRCPRKLLTAKNRSLDLKAKSPPRRLDDECLDTAEIIYVIIGREQKSEGQRGKPNPNI